MRQAALALAFLLALPFSACGGGRSLPDPLEHVAPATPTRLVVSERAADIDDFVAPDSTSLRVVSEALWVYLTERGFAPFDPSAALADSPIRGFASYLTWQERFLEGDVHHVAFVVTEEWTPARTRAFVDFFGPMPAMTPVQAGAPRFHFVSRYPVPPAAQYVFSNEWYGSLESRLATELRDAPADPADAPVFAQRVRLVFRQWGIEIPEGRGAIEILDAARAALPPAIEPDGWRPHGTLMALGLLLGDELRRELGNLEWTEGQAGLATLYALSVSDAPDAILRPIDFALQAWGAANPAPFAAYRELVSTRVAEVAGER